MTGVVEHIRKSSETIILILVVLSPWAFGCIHPFFRYVLTAGLCAVMLLWSAELLIAPQQRLLTRFQLPLIGLVLIACLQVIPLGGIADLLSPTSAKWKAAMLPDSIEQLADGSQAIVPAMTARSRISLYPAETLRRGYWLVLMALLFTRIQDLASPASLKRLCYVCLINGSILAYFSVIQHFTSETGKIFWTFQSMGAAFGPFVNRNHFAFYTNICFGLALGLVGSRQMGTSSSFSVQGLVDGLKDSVSLWMISVLVFMLGAVILCSSRGGMISLVGSSLITAAFISATGTFKQGWKWFVLAAVIFAVAAGVQISLGFDFAGKYGNTVDDRTGIWKPLLTLVGQFPLTGSGLGTLPHVEPGTRPLIGARDYYLEYAHNEYLQLAIEMGIPGLILVCTLMYLLFAKIARRIRHSRHNAWLYVGLLFSLTSVCLHSFTEFGFAIPAIAFLVAIVMGNIAGIGRPKREGTISASEQGVARAFAIGILIFVVVAFQDAKLFDLGERSLLQAQRAHNEQRTDDEVNHYLTALQSTPDDVEMLLEVARLQLLVNKEQSLANPPILKQAQQILIFAREVCPLAADSHFFLGMNTDTLAKSDTELTYYQRALSARPTDATLAFITALAYDDNGGTEKAMELFRQSLTLSDVHLGEVLQLAVTEVVPKPEPKPENAIDSPNLDSEKEPTKSETINEVVARFNTQAATTDVERLNDFLNVLPDSATLLLAAAKTLDKSAAKKQTGAASELAGTLPIFSVSETLRRRALASNDLKQPGSAELFQTKAELHQQLGELDDSIRAWEAAIRYEPGNLKWRLAVAKLLGEKAKSDPEYFERAEFHLRRIIQRETNHRAARKFADELNMQRRLQNQSSSRTSPDGSIP